MTKRNVLLAMRGQAEEDLLRTIATSPQFQVTRRCVEPAEVLAAALAGVGEVAVIDYLLGVDRTFIHRLRQAGVLTVVAAPQTNREVVEQLGGIYLDVASSDLHGDLCEALVGRDNTPPRQPAQEAEADPAPQVIAVTSAWGSPGRTTIAVNLAAELAGRGLKPLLVDADVWGGSIKQYLGLDPDGAGLATAVRAVERGTLDLDGLTRLTETAYGIHVLGGLNKSDRWREVSGAGLSSLWETVQGWPGHVIVDAPVRLAAGDDANQFGPDPNSMWDALTAAATSICMVATADTIGIHRFVNFYLDAMVGVDHTVINRLRASAGGPRAKESVLELLDRFTGITDPILIPDDVAVDRAILEGAPLRIINAKSPARIAIRSLAQHYAPSRQRTRPGVKFGLGARNGAH